MRGLWLAIICLIGLAAHAHEVRPGYLQLKQIDGQTYEMFWKVPSVGDAAPKLRVVLPGDPEITELGRPFLRNICMPFDAYLNGPRGGNPATRFSATV